MTGTDEQPGAPGALTRAEREMLAAVASAAQDCDAAGHSAASGARA